MSPAGTSPLLTAAIALGCFTLGLIVAGVTHPIVAVLCVIVIALTLIDDAREDAREELRR